MVIVKGLASTDLGSGAIGVVLIEPRFSEGVEVNQRRAAKCRANWRFRRHWRHGQNKSCCVDREQFVDATDTLDLEYRYQLSRRADVSVYINNSLNDVYRISADELLTFGNQSSVGVRLNYRLNPVYGK